MKKIYSIGRFQFDSYTEYKKGLEDVKKIKYISDEMDINEPGVALRLYTLIRQKDIKFQSVIGDDYLLYLSDMLADDFKELSVQSEDSNAYLANLGRTRSPRKFAGVLCIIVAVCCFAYFIGSEVIANQRTRQMRELQESRELDKAAQYIADMINGRLSGEEQQAVPVEEHAAAGTQGEAVQVPLNILPEYAALHEQNPDMVGWITIPGTEIDYPVTQSGSEDPYYYLSHNFNKEEDKNGSIFLDQRNSLENQDSNLILYGHNMRSGVMFGSLKEYLDEAYLQEHTQIQFDTLYEKRKYDIIAVCLAKVEYQDEEGFRYYNFLNAGSQEVFEEFKANVESLNVYGDQVAMEYGDQLITLSTCNNYIEDGRMFLVARRVE